MPIHFFDLDRCMPMPWKNGGGTTQEIVCWPLDGSMNQFDWRISVANIDKDGPFSAYPGLDRTIMLLSGNGVRLQARDGSFNHCMKQPFEPFRFSGDVALDSTLIDGATQDFNVMTMRHGWSAQVHIIRNAFTLPASEYGLLLNARGIWSITQTARASELTTQIAPKHGLWWAEETIQVQATPQTEEALLIHVQIQKKPS